MSQNHLPELNDSERLIGTDTLEAFIDVSWRKWTFCSGMKRPFIWQRAKRKMYRKIVGMNKEIMLDMLAHGDFEDCFVFCRNVGVVHALRHRPDFGSVKTEKMPHRRLLFMGNGCLRGGSIMARGA